MKIMLKNEERKVVLLYIATNEEAKAADKKAKALKEQAAAIFARYGADYKVMSKSEYAYATIQKDGVAEPIVCRTTTRKGSVNERKVAERLGMTYEDYMAIRDSCRNDDTVYPSIDFATESQRKELGL